MSNKITISVLNEFQNDFQKHCERNFLGYPDIQFCDE